MDNRNDFLANLRVIRKKSPLQTGITSFESLLKTQAESAGKKTPRESVHHKDLEALLRENAKPLNLEVHSCSSPEQAVETITAIATGNQPEFTEETAIVYHDHPTIRRMQLSSKLSAQHIPCFCTTVDTPDLRTKTLKSSIGITVADWGVADCAAVVQLTTPARPRSTSLVPSVHIAILSRKTLLPSLEQLYQKLQGESLPNSFVFISGPSKTADIEAHMVLGAHGPREMHLLLVD